MKYKTVCFVPLISTSFTDNWESDDDSLEGETHYETQEYSENHQTPSMQAQHNPSPESVEEKKLFLKKETGKKRLCSSCKRDKSKEPFMSTEKCKIQDKSLEDDKFYHNQETSKKDCEETSKQLTCDENGRSNGEGKSADMKSMKPVPPSIRKHIYKGISHEGNGRSKYLQMRYHSAPEDRWYYPATSSMQYGWTWGYPPEITAPEHGKKQIILHSFFRPNDINIKSQDYL